MSLNDDADKVKELFSKVKIEGGPWNVERLGEPTTNGRNRVAKVVFPSKKDRDEAVKKSITLKDLGEPWNKIYLNRDEHSVYRAEKNRLRRKMNDLRKKPEFEDNPKERVKIIKGDLVVDDEVVDKNTFKSSSFQ